jgi:hypothetical protein
MSSGQQLVLARLLRLIPGPPGPTYGLPLARLTAASYFLGDWQDTQATTLEQQLFVGAVCQTQPSSGNPLTPSLDPRFTLWYGFNPNAPDPNPTLVPSPASEGTGSATAAGAVGAFLDLWGAAFGNTRWRYWDAANSVWVNETDTAYALRILTDIARPSTTNYGLSILLDAALGLTGTGFHVQVVDAALGTFKRYNSGLRFGDSNFAPSASSRAPGFVAGNAGNAGAFIVDIPLARNADQSIGPLRITTAFINLLVNRRKAAGTSCTNVYALGEY